jgi:hypothetical protein
MLNACFIFDLSLVKLNFLLLAGALCRYVRSNLLDIAPAVFCVKRVALT